MSPLAILQTLAGILITCVLFFGGCSVGQRKAASEIADLQSTITRIQVDAQAEAFRQSEELRLSEQAEADRFAEIATMHQKDLTDAQADADRLADDLRAQHRRLRQQWRCPVPGPQEAPAVAGEPDGRTDDWQASAGRIVRAADGCDAQVIGLQALLLDERRE